LLDTINKLKRSGQAKESEINGFTLKDTVENRESVFDSFVVNTTN